MLASLIDHTLLKAEATFADHEKLFNEAKQYSFKTVCVNSLWVPAAVSALKGSGVGVCTVVGFPLGANLAKVKSYEARQAIECGADEVDMVLAVGLLKQGQYEEVFSDLAIVRQATLGKTLKVILETALLTETEIVSACELCLKAGVDFVKTSTGFSAAGGATEATVKLIKKTVGSQAQVKASGGIRDFETARMMVQAGATRLGTSASVAIVLAEQGKSSTLRKENNGNGY